MAQKRHHILLEDGEGNTVTMRLRLDAAELATFSEWITHRSNCGHRLLRSEPLRAERVAKARPRRAPRAAAAAAPDSEAHHG